VVKPNAAPTASFTSTTDGLKATLDASGSTDADGDTLTYSWDLGDGTSATGLLADHVYAESGTYTVTLTVDDGNATATSQKDVTVVKPNAAPTASFTSTTDGHTATLDASGSTDADGDALTYSWDLGDGTTKTGVAIGHTYAGDGSYTVTLTVDDGQATNTAQRTVSVAAPAPSQQYSADFRVSPNVNEWWVEVTVQATSEPAKVEVSVDGGSWIALDKTSWGTWAKSTYTPVGSSVVFRAMDASGQTATSSTYTWMTTEPEPDPFTATFRPKTQSNPWWVEVVVTASEEVVRVQACIGATCTDLSKTEWDSWAKKMRVKKGTEVVFVATSISGATATSQAFVWG
ncbi:MAG: PKD domain-containing protein, partial [Euryarchaeota archaeon]|nr:PKD domain-containing protein [Euryarchaeota archaeon]